MLGMMFMPATVRAEAEEEAVRVYRDVQESVVGLQNAEGSGTGILLDSFGTILTNAHVVVSPLPFTCTVDVTEDGKKRSVRFERVKVIGFDPRLDLALLHINPAEQHVALKPVVINPQKGEVGQRIYAIGNPGSGGHILTKTMTSGMISAVDRELDGDLYYQIDAGINQGNSGGPICDRNGQVLGLVTLKSNDAEAIGFAIPLQDLATSRFIPLLERNAKPQLAERYIKLGATAHEKARQIAASLGGDNTTRMRLDIYACQMYHAALTYDPSNPVIYSSIGDFWVSLGNADKISIAYLARFFRLNPWHGGAIYVNLGYSYGKLNLERQRAIVFKEGLAKYPWHSSLWESRAFSDIFYHDVPSATWDFNMALFLGVRQDRFELIKGLLKENLSHLTPEERKTFDAKNNVQYKLEILDHMTDLSNAARKSRQLYMTQDFADLIAQTDGPPLTVAKDRVPQTPEERPLHFRNLLSQSQKEQLSSGSDIAKP
jgi:hypothetical protein